jgi:hypothetical protein
MIKKQEYREGPKARETFDKGMTKLFQASKEAAKETKPKPKRKRKTASKD